MWRLYYYYYYYYYYYDVTWCSLTSACMIVICFIKKYLMIMYIYIFLGLNCYMYKENNLYMTIFQVLYFEKSIHIYFIYMLSEYLMIFFVFLYETKKKSLTLEFLTYWLNCYILMKHNLYITIFFFFWSFVLRKVIKYSLISIYVERIFNDFLHTKLKEMSRKD